MKKKTLAAIAVVLFIGIAGCSGSGPLDASDVDAIGTEGDVTDISTLWDQDDGGAEEDDNGSVKTDDGDGSGSENKSTDNGGNDDECDFDAPTLGSVSDATVELGEYVDIELTVKGGSGDFRWNLLSELPLGLVLEKDDDKGAIKGFPGEAGEFPIKISVRDLECGETSNEVSFTLTVKTQKVDIPTYHMVPISNSNPADGMEPIQAQKFGVVEEVRIHLTTGQLKRSGTDANIYIDFCGDRDCAKRTIDSHELDDPDHDDMEKGNMDVFKIEGEWTKDELKYFTITTDNARNNAGWMLEGIKVEYIMSDGTKELAYWNPCVHKFLNGVFDYLQFGPDDVSICSVVKTADVKNAGTDDKIYVIFPDYDNDVFSGKGNYDYKEGPYFTDKFDFLAIKLGWDIGDYDDFERGDEGRYGDYSFDKDPFASTDGVPSGVNVQKSKDGKKGGWYLSAITVAVFKPAQNFVYAGGCKENNTCDAQIKEQTLMYYAMRKNLSESEGWIQSDSSKGLREGLNLGDGPVEGMIEFRPLGEWTETFSLDDFSNIGRQKP